MTRSSIHREILSAVSSGITHLEDLYVHFRSHKELAKLAEQDFLSPEEYLLFEIDESIRFFITDADEVIRLDEVASGLVFTHRLTETEIARDLVDMHPDLTALDLGIAQLSSPVGPVTEESVTMDDLPFERDCWVGPPGWLSGFNPGDLVAFRRSGERVEVGPAGTVGKGTAEASAIREGFDEVYDLQEKFGEETWLILREAIALDDTLFRRPVRPISELLVDAGLSFRGTSVGPRDTPWKRPGVAPQRLRDALSQKYELDRCCDEALDLVIYAWDSYWGGNHPAEKPVNRALAHGEVVDAFTDWLKNYFGIDSDGVKEFVGRLASAGSHTAATQLVLARHYEALGDVLAAEQALEEAVQTDPDFGPALAELSWYASDRGDADRVVSLRRRAGFGDDDSWISLHASLGSSQPEVGRNDPCPCGSGRKYKQCHLGRTEVSEHERVAWLIGKLTVFMTRPERMYRLFELASSAVGEDFELYDMDEMRRDEFIISVAMFEDGGVSDFLERRGPLLPEDEYEVLEQWRDVSLQLWEVVSSDGESNITFRDTGSGDTKDVTDDSSAPQLQTGDQILTRLLPAWGKTWMSHVVVRIAPQHRDSLLSVLDEYPDPDSLARWYGQLLAPPQMSNREGEPMVFSEVLLKPTTKWDNLEAALDENYEKDDEDEVWYEHMPLNDDEIILRALIRRDDDEIVVVVNSEERRERVLATLGEVAEVVSQTARPITSPEDFTDLFGTPGETWEPGSDPQVPTEELLEMRDRLERRWLDGDVPALGGMTPRQAAADPTRREDLIALLRSFERMPQHGITLRPDVLRKELGLTD